jgi:hypothetical protein
MNRILPLLCIEEIERLLLGEPISAHHPWVTKDDRLIEDHLRRACGAVRSITKTEARIEWNHYGSGYASFVDAWFYRPASEFNVRKSLKFGEEHTGLVVLLSRLSPYFAFMEGEQRWNAQGSSSYLPDFSALDKLEAESVALLAQQAQSILEGHGLIRAYHEQLSEPLPASLHVPTILTSGGFKQFDALFFWED